MDTVAELLKIHDASPLASMKDYLAAATLQELDSAELPAVEALAVVRGDLLVLKAQAEEIRVGAEETGMYDVASAMEDQLTDYNKTLWFLRAMGK